MFDLNLLKDDVIIITPFKKDVLKFINQFDYSIKVINKNELLENISFKYDDSSIVFLMNKGYSYNKAKELLSNLHFVKEGTDKLNFLTSLKKELEDHELLTSNYLYPHLFDNKEVYVYGYSSLDLELKKLLENIQVVPTYLEDTSRNRYVHKVKEFDSIEEEVDNFFNEVSLLVSQGTNLSDIKLLSYPSEYDLLIKKYAGFYKIPISLDEKFTLYSSSFFNEFISYYQNSSLEEAYEYIVSIVSEDKYCFLETLKGLIVDIKDLFSDKEKEYEYLISKAKDTYLSLPKYVNGLEIVSTSYLEDKDIFILGFNLLSYPIVKKDITLINDNEKEYLGINTTYRENQIEEEKLIKFISSHSKLHISYKNKVGKNEFYPSLLIDKLNLVKEKGEVNLLRGSLNASVLLTSFSKDKERNFGVKDEYFSSLDENLVNYKTYSHHFEKFDELNNKGNMSISYSSLNSYNKCPFMYYLDKVLALNDFKTTFDMELGSLFHLILERSSKDDITLEDILLECDNKFSKPEELFFARKASNNLYQLIQLNQKMIEENPSLKVVCEKKISILLDQYTTLLGYVDKIIFSEKDKVLMLVDYKTGNEVFDERKIRFGLSLQLPIYSLLLDEYYQDYDQMGIFIQSVIPSEEDYRLNGIMKKDISKIKIFDQEFGLPTYASKYFAGAKINKDGEFISSKALLEEEAWNKVILESKEQVINTISKIRQGEFSISPIVMVDENNSSPCLYCSHRSICFKEKSDQREERKGV